MASFVGTFAKGRVIEKCALPLGTDNILIIPLQSSGLPSDTTLRNAANLAAIFTAGALEATFTGYARKVLSSSDITIANNTGTFVATATVNAAQTWASAGGALNNTITKIVVAYRPTSGTADSGCMVLATQDYSGSTTGGAFTVTVGVLSAT